MPLLPWPSRTLPSGVAEGPRWVRPPWFSNPASTRVRPLDLDLDRDVADQPGPGFTDGRQIGDAESGDRLVAELVAVAEQLIAAADGEQGGAVADRLGDRLTLARDQVGGDGALVPILAATDVDQVVSAGVEGLPGSGRRVLEADPAPLAALLKQGHVAAIRVDVHLLRVERQQTQRGGRGCSIALTPASAG